MSLFCLSWIQSTDLSLIAAQYYETYIQWNYTLDVWECCGDNGCNGTVTIDTFSALPPSQWSAIPTDAATSLSQSSTLASQISTSGSTTMVTTASISSSTTASQTGSKSKGGGALTTGDKAGMGVAIGIAGIAFIAAVFAIALWRRERSRKISANDSTTANTSTAMEDHNPPPPPYLPQLSEAGGDEVRTELAGDVQQTELPTEGQQVHELADGTDPLESQEKSVDAAGLEAGED